MMARIPDPESPAMSPSKAGSSGKRMNTRKVSPRSCAARILVNSAVATSFRTSELGTPVFTCEMKNWFSM